MGLRVRGSGRDIAIWGVRNNLTKRRVTPNNSWPLYFPKGPSIPYLWLLVPKMDPKSYNREHLDPWGSLRG